MADVALVVERNDTGRVFETPVGPWGAQYGSDVPKALPNTSSHRNPTRTLGLASLHHVLFDLFLPAGYPASVSPDYLEYQVYNALQAFCSSLSGLLASRGALEGILPFVPLSLSAALTPAQGVGVGDASASATHALLLTVLKDAFSRLTTILGAYCFGTSLYPETKTFRYLADVLNDASTVLDTVVPFIGSVDLEQYSSALPSGATLQLISLCLSGALRSLCVLVAGGSKSALTNHFASPSSGKGDVGEVSAKDASRETVVGLSGMLLGTLFIPYVTTRAATYTVLFVLVGAHLAFNYFAVRAVVLRTLNRQRACILWTSFKVSNGTRDTKALSPASVASKEILFNVPNNIRDASTGRRLGKCTLGASFRSITLQCAAEQVTRALPIFNQEHYVLLVTGGNGRGPRSITTSVCFKDGYRAMDQLQAWIHAIEVARRLHGSGDSVDPVDVLGSTLLATREALPAFVQSLIEAGWETADDSMMFGSPNRLILEINRGPREIPADGEDKKTR